MQKQKTDSMTFREFGRAGMRIFHLGFGCGAAGELMVRGERSAQER